MHVRIDRAALLKGLYFAQSIAERKGTNPIVSHVLLRTQGTDALVCAATDLRLSVVSELAAEASKEGGLCVAAKNLYEIVRSLPEGELVLRSADGKAIEIVAGRARYKLVGLAARDFPKIPDHHELNFAELPARVLADLLSKTAFSISTDDTRPHLAGILFESDGATMVAVSTDGHRLTKMQHLGAGAPQLAKGVIIPRKGVAEIRRLIDGVDGACDVGFTNTHVFVRASDVVLSVALVEAQFPPYRQVIPADNEKRLILRRAPLIDALKRASIMSSERSYGVRMELAAGKLRITSDNPDVGEAEEELDLEYDGPELTIGFNARYFIDALSQLDDESICLELNGELDPGLVRPAANHDYVSVIMPMRI